MALKLELTEQAVNIILEALSNTPYRVSAAVINELAQQLQAQQQGIVQQGAGPIITAAPPAAQPATPGNGSSGL